MVVMLSVSASAFKLYVNDMDKKVSVDEVATYNLSLFNDDVYTEHYTFSVPDIRWSAYTDPVVYMHHGLTLLPDGQQYIPFYVKARKDTPVGKYQFLLEIESDRGQKESRVIGIDIIPTPPVIIEKIYDVDVDVGVIIPSKVDPRDVLNIQVVLTNKNPRSYKNVEIVLESELFERSLKTDLEGNRTKKTDFSVNLDQQQDPGKHKVTVTVLLNDKEHSGAYKDFEVVEYLPPFTQTETISEMFLKTVRRLNLRNDANVVKNRSVQSKVVGWKSLFVKSDPKYYVENIDGDKYLSWDIHLEPGDETAILITYDYRPLFIALVVLIIGIVLYQLLKSPVVVSKQISQIETKEGSLSEMKVVLTIKNRRDKSAKHIRIIEKIPKFVQIVNDFNHTLSPTKKYNYNNGSVIQWELENFDPREERIISYRIRTKLSFVGSFKLLPTIVEYTTEGSKNKMISISNSLDVVSE